MRMSTLVGRRFKEQPSEASLVSHGFLLRGGYIRQVSNGIYSLLPAGVRVAQKIERVIREEMNALGGQEVLMPVVLPRELWDESGRYEGVGDELLRFVDRTGHQMLLAMTHEEGVVHLVRNEVSSYKEYPFMVYQIQTKFRDEPRSRGGLIRVREFSMKDAYSFHCTQQDLDAYYSACAGAYKRIFARVGLPQVAEVQSDTGMMGGNVAHEYMLLCDSGEDTVVSCDSCEYIANREVARAVIEPCKEQPRELEKVHTPGCKTIAEVAGFLNVAQSRTAKVVFYEQDADGTPVCAMIRGDLDINEAKLAKLLKTQPQDASEETVYKIGSVPGYGSGMDLKNCRVIADTTIRDSSNLVCGANEEEYHYYNFNMDRDTPDAEVADIAQAREGDGCPGCTDGHLVFSHGIEVGNIFQLGTKYTEAMGMTYLDEQGKSATPIMGCYGIGIGRLISSVIEAHHDTFGPLWPVSIAPWQVHINALQHEKPQCRTWADEIYNELLEQGIEVVYDDRNERPGAQFADADLIGAPLRIIVSPKNCAQNVVELKRRGEKESLTVSRESVVEEVCTRLDTLYKHNDA